MTPKSEVRESVAADGRRVQERVTRIELEDGSIQEVCERLEEVVPMETTKRVTKKFAQVPVEIKTEVFNGGVVETSVKNIPDSELELSDGSHHTFHANFGKEANCGCPTEVAAKSFMNKAVSKYRTKKHCNHHNMEALPIEGSNKTEQVVSSLMWIALAVVTGLVVFAMI